MSIKLFGGFGVEIEYMIVDSSTLNVKPVADKLLEQLAGELVNETVLNSIGVSNEFVLHVIELKTADVPPRLEGIAADFSGEINTINRTLEKFGARLMPTAAHPWMDPHKETRLWPHDNREIYDTYDRIFNCKGHGWGNLQSVHLNLPFHGEEEFVKLHSAIRLLLPVMCALSASSPVLDGVKSGFLDTRMEYYRTNSSIIPSVTGDVVPEPVRSIHEYKSNILEKMYMDTAPYDPEGILRDEWLNARGAIARFDRNAIEIRVLDTQENPRADLAVCALISSALQKITANTWGNVDEQLSFDNKYLFSLFQKVIKEAHLAEINNRDYLKALGFPEKKSTAGELWQHLYETSMLGATRDEWEKPLNTIFNKGPLAARILKSLGNDLKRERLFEIYAALCDSLENDTIFHG